MEHQYSNSYIHVHIFILICSNSPTTCYNPWNLWRWQSWVKIMDCSHFPSGPNWHNGTHMCHTSLVDHKSSMSVKMLEALPFSMAAFFLRKRWHPKTVAGIQEDSGALFWPRHDPWYLHVVRLGANRKTPNESFALRQQKQETWNSLEHAHARSRLQCQLCANASEKHEHEISSCVPRLPTMPWVKVNCMMGSQMRTLRFDRHLGWRKTHIG